MRSMWCTLRVRRAPIMMATIPLHPRTRAQTGSAAPRRPLRPAAQNAHPCSSRRRLEHGSWGRGSRSTLCAGAGAWGNSRRACARTRRSHPAARRSHLADCAARTADTDPAALLPLRGTCGRWLASEYSLAQHYPTWPFPSLCMPWALAAEPAGRARGVRTVHAGAAGLVA